MKKFPKRIWAIFACLVTLLFMSPVSVRASGPIDTEARCVLDLAFIPEGIVANGIEFRLYKVASVSAACRFTVSERFSAYGIDPLLENPDTDSYNVIASTLSNEIAADPTILPDASSVTDNTGHALFKNLDVGLYLIMGDVFHSGEYFYYPQACLISLPERLEDDTWNYLVSASGKWDKRWDSEPVDISVMKIWEDSAIKLHNNEVVQISLYKDGKLYDTIRLSTENNWTYTWKDLYGGAVWTVKEKKITGYKTTITRKGDLFIISNKPDDPDIPPPIPDTGMTWWPVPVLLGAGFVLALIGLRLKNKDKEDEIA